MDRQFQVIKLKGRFHWDNIMLKFERYLFEPYFCFYINPTVVVDCLKVKILFVCTAWFTESYKLASYLFAKDKLNAKMKSGFWLKSVYLKLLDNRSNQSLFYTFMIDSSPSHIRPVQLDRIKSVLVFSQCWKCLWPVDKKMY